MLQVRRLEWGVVIYEMAGDVSMTGYGEGNNEYNEQVNDQYQVYIFTHFDLLHT